MSVAAIPLVDLQRQYDEIATEARQAFERIASAGQFELGDELAAFEQEFAAFCGSDHCVGVGSGTDALQLALLAMGVGAGDEVVTVPNTYIATVEAIARVGARPVLADVDPATASLDASRLEGTLSDATRAVVPVHLFGRPAAMREITAVCERSGLDLLEDAAQAHGAKLDGRSCGGWGRAGAFSFYPSKNLGAFGDGGAIVTSDAAVAESVRSLRTHGCAPDDRNRHLRIGGTHRLDNLQAAILRIKLRRLEGWNEQRARAAQRYRERLSGLPVTLPAAAPPQGTHAYHLFVVEVDDRDGIFERMRAAGVGVGIHYPTPVHLQPGWRWLGYGEGDFPAAERLTARGLSLPCFPGIEDEEIDRVADALEKALGRSPEASQSR